MSRKADTLRDSETNDDSSDEDSSKEREDHRQSKCSEKRKKHKKHKKQKKSKKHKKERNSSDSESRSKSGTGVSYASADLIASYLNKKTTLNSASPAENRYSKGSKHNGKGVESYKQITSRWDSSGEGEHSRQTLDSKSTGTHHSDSRRFNTDGRVEKDRLNTRDDRDNIYYEQYKSTRSKQSSKSVDRNTHHMDCRENELAAHQGNRNGNQYSRAFDKHGSSQRYRPDSSNRSIHDASSSRDNEKCSSSHNLGQRIHQFDRDVQGDRHKQSETDKYSTSGQKRRHGESPYKQHMGNDIPSQTRDRSGDRQKSSKFQIKEEKASRYDEESQLKWGKEADSKSKPLKANANGDRNNESANTGDSAASSVPNEKEKPNFGLSGKLTEETNKVHGVVLAYAEPPGSRKPKRRWRLYPFKGDQALPTLYIHRQSCYLIGRERKVCDIPVDHPSCSKQHAVLQYRLVPYERVDGTKSQCVRPYIIDLESANGTFVNNKKIEAKRYLELREKDVLKFGFSSREYVLLHENSKEDNEDDEGYDVSPVIRASSDSTHPSKVEAK